MTPPTAAPRNLGGWTCTITATPRPARGCSTSRSTCTRARGRRGSRPPCWRASPRRPRIPTWRPPVPRSPAATAAPWTRCSRPRARPRPARWWRGCGRGAIRWWCTRSSPSRTPRWKPRAITSPWRCAGPRTASGLQPAAVPADADLVVVGNPVNPTGVLHPAAVIRSLVRPGRLVVVDEAFLDAVPGEPETLAGEPGVLVLRSLTKHWSIPGIRAGYAIGEPGVIAGLAALQAPWSVSSPAIAAMVAIAGAAAESAWRARELTGWREHVEAGLRDRGVAFPVSAAPFVLARAGAGVHAALRGQGVAVRRGRHLPVGLTTHGSASPPARRSRPDGCSAIRGAGIRSPASGFSRPDWSGGCTPTGGPVACCTSRSSPAARQRSAGRRNGSPPAGRCCAPSSPPWPRGRCSADARSSARRWRCTATSRSPIWPRLGSGSRTWSAGILPSCRRAR